MSFHHRRFLPLDGEEEARETFICDGEFGTAEESRRFQNLEMIKPERKTQIGGSALFSCPRSINGGVQSQARSWMESSTRCHQSRGNVMLVTKSPIFLSSCILARDRWSGACWFLICIPFSDVLSFDFHIMPIWPRVVLEAIPGELLRRRRRRRKKKETKGKSY